MFSWSAVSTLKPLQKFFFMFLALFMGLQPSPLALQTLVVVCFLWMFRLPLFWFIAISVSAFLLSGLVFDPILEGIGRGLLTSTSLSGLWGGLFDLPIVPLTRLNNTMFMGAAVLALLISFLFVGLSEYLKRSKKAASAITKEQTPVEGV